MTESPNGWNEYSEFVKRELKRLADSYDLLRLDYGNICTEIAILKVKAGIWGLIGGCIPVAVALLVYYVKK